MTTKLSESLSHLRHGIFPNAERVNALLDHCIAQAEAQEAQAGELSDAFVKARAMEIYPPDEVNDGHPWYGHRRAIEDTAAQQMVRHLHRCGYLRPSQPIGEQTPVDENELILRMKNAPVVLVPTASSEARDMAISALDAAKLVLLMNANSNEFYERRAQIRPFIDQALSALRGE